MSQRSLEPEVVRSMFQKAEEKLRSAENSLASDFFDDASSRAYYAAFHAVTAVLGSKGLSYASHGQTIGAFNREIVKAGILEPGAFRKIQRLFADRQTGDYDASSSITAEQAAHDIEDARWLVEKCQDIIGESVKENGGS